MTSCNTTIASFLGALAPCGFFLWLAVSLGMLLTKNHCSLTKTFCLGTDINSCTGALHASTDQTWQDGQHHIKIALSLDVLAPCIFFPWLAVCLGMLLTKIHCFLTKTVCLRTDIKSCIGALQVQTWEDGQHPLPEGPGGLHAQEARGCHQKGWQHIQVLVTMLFNNFFNFICSINVKTNMWGQFLLRWL